MKPHRHPYNPAFALVPADSPIARRSLARAGVLSGQVYYNADTGEIWVCDESGILWSNRE